MNMNQNQNQNQIKTRDEIMAEIKRLDTETEVMMRKQLPLGKTSVEIPIYIRNILKMETLYWVLNENGGKMPNTRRYNEGTWDDEEKSSLI